MSLEQFLRHFEELGVIDFSLRGFKDREGRQWFYVHPTGVNGSTATYRVIDNVLVPVDYAEYPKL